MCIANDYTTQMSLKGQLKHARYQVGACKKWIRTTPQNELQVFAINNAKKSLVFWQNEVQVLKTILQNEQMIGIACLLKMGHAFSMSYRIWYYGSLDNTLKFRETHWGTNEEMLNFIKYARAVRVDAYDAEYGWATVWLTSKEFLSLSGGAK